MEDVDILVIDNNQADTWTRPGGTHKSTFWDIFQGHDDVLPPANTD
jgi:hypothetical protein